MVEIKSLNVSLALSYEMLKIMCGAGVSSEMADGIFGATASLVSRTASKVTNLGMGGALQNQLSFEITANTFTSATEESIGQKRCKKITLLPSADATLQDSFLNSSDRSPCPEYLLRLIGMELELPRFS